MFFETPCETCKTPAAYVPHPALDGYFIRQRQGHLRSPLGEGQCGTPWTRTTFSGFSVRRIHHVCQGSPFRCHNMSKTAGTVCAQPYITKNSVHKPYCSFKLSGRMDGIPYYFLQSILNSSHRNLTVHAAQMNFRT